MWGEVPIFAAFAPSWCFSIEAVNHLCPSNKPKKACIRSCDTNNFTQSLTRKYHHTATESLYCLCDEKISWASTLAGLSYYLASFLFPFAWNTRSLDHQFFRFFSMKSHIIKLEKWRIPIFANKFRGLKSP